MEVIKNLFKDNTQMALISMGVTLVSHIFFSAAINYDTKLNHKKYGNLWTSAAFLFGIVPVGFYYVFRRILPEKVPIVCAKCGKKALKDRKKCPHCGSTNFVPLKYDNVGAVKNRIIIFLAIAIVLYAFDIWYTQYSPWAPDEEEVIEEVIDDFDDSLYDDVRFGYEEKGKTVYYDREGKQYTDPYNVYFYDKNGNIFTFDADIYVSVSGKEKISSKAALVDSNGYLVDAEAKFENIPDVLPFKTQDGTMYYLARDISWNKDGKMVYTSNGKPVN